MYHYRDLRIQKYLVGELLDVRLHCWYVPKYVSTGYYNYVPINSECI